MSRNQDAWEKLYNAGGINPSLNPKNLSNVLRDVGVNRAGQDVVFKGLTDMSKQLVYDLSFPGSVKDIKTLGYYRFSWSC